MKSRLKYIYKLYCPVINLKDITSMGNCLKSKITSKWNFTENTVVLMQYLWICQNLVGDIITDVDYWVLKKNNQWNKKLFQYWSGKMLHIVKA